MTELKVELKQPIKGSEGLIQTVVFKKQPTAKQLIEIGTLVANDNSIIFENLAKYIDALTDLDFSEIERLGQIDFSNIGQRLIAWTYTDAKKS